MPRSRLRFDRLWGLLGTTMWRTHLHTKRRAKTVQAVLR